MVEPADLPKIAWEVLSRIADGEPLTDGRQIKWAKAFAQINWVVAIGDNWSLAPDGDNALREKRGRVPSPIRSVNSK